MTPIRSLDDARALLADLPGPDNRAAEQAAVRDATLTKPPGALGRLEGLVEWICGWQAKHPPTLDRCRMAIFAGNHGVTAEGVSAFPADVTQQMIGNFRAGGAAINQLCALTNTDIRIFPIALETPTQNFVDAPAMSEPECAEAMAIDAEIWVGPGTGVTGDAYSNKIRVVRNAVDFHRPFAGDGLSTLCRFGGREMAAIAGAIIAARHAKVPVLLDGYVCCAAAAALFAVNNSILDHCIVGHASAEPGHRHLLEAVNQHPLLDLDMRLGEGSGAALALMILKAAVACHNGMATFDEAKVSGKSPESA